MTSRNEARDAFSRALDRLSSVIAYLAGVIILAMVALMFASVVMRYVLNNPLTWSDQLSTWMFVWTTYLGMTVAYRHGIHIRVDVLTRRLPTRTGLVVDCLIDVLVGVFLVVFIYYGQKIAVQALNQVYGSLELPPSIIYAAAPVSGAIVFLFLLDNLRRHLGALVSPMEGEQPK
jgi:TRAP-type C4-dicarboxylate transport system permease small subunit